MLKKNILYLIIISILIYGCGSYNDKKPSIIGAITDNDEWYEGMDERALETSVSVQVPNDLYCSPWDDPTAPPRPCTLDDILNDDDAWDDYEPEIRVHYENENFLVTGYNAVMEQKGRSTREAPQDSFRIKLDSDTELYNNEQTFQLNKHPYDDTRMRNKLFFELFQTIPNIPSLRTQFVHLTIDGQDYGLFTHIEKCDELYLKNHNFSEDDNLYKAENFTFRMTPELELDSKGDPIDPDAFDTVLKIENGKETQKVIDMINAINNAQTEDDFKRVFERYFDLDNYITWIAINIVVANKDTINQNFFLLNPKFSDKFYFLPWDYDGAGRDNSRYPKWQLGLATWWDVPLYKKFIQVPEYREKLNEMIYNIRDNYITDKAIQEKMDSFRPTVEKYIQMSPDADYLSYSRWLDAFNLLRNNQTAINMQNYESQIGHPMPFWQSASYDRETNTLKLIWNKSIDLEGDPIVYTVEVTTGDDLNFTSPLIHEEYIPENDPRFIIQEWGDIEYSINMDLEPGTYLMKVTSYEEYNHDHYQISFDGIRVNTVLRYDGVLEFTVE